MESNSKLKRGFACLSPERRREIARIGGRRAHELGAAHEFTSAEAQSAGRRGGMTIAKDRDHMRRIGQRGGFSRQKKQPAT